MSKFRLKGVAIVVAIVLTLTFSAPSAFAIDPGEWLRTDLHTHSIYSVNEANGNIEDIMQDAVIRRGLTGLAVTDHDNNFRSLHPSYADAWVDPDYISSSDLVLLYGCEWTDSDGHANVWNDTTYDYTDMGDYNESKDPQAACDYIHSVGGLFSINHPYSGNPWNYSIPTGIDAVEIWNGANDNDDYKAMWKMWSKSCLDAGKKVTAVGGSDMHYLSGPLSGFNLMGIPSTWGYFTARTPAAFETAIRNGYMTLSATYEDPRAELLADYDMDGTYEKIMGENIANSTSKTVNFKIKLVGVQDNGYISGKGSNFLSRCTGYYADNQIADLKDELEGAPASNELLVVVMKNGTFIKGWNVDDKQEVTFSDTVAGTGTKSYYSVEVYGNSQYSSSYDGRIAATNPIYFNY